MDRMKRYLQLTTVKVAQRTHEGMLCAGEAAQKEALTRDGHPGLTAGANLCRAYGAGSRGIQLSDLVFSTLCS